MLNTILVMTLFFSLLAANLARGEEPEYSNIQIVEAIFRAEGGLKTRHPYGILTKYKHTGPRQACFNTVRNARRRFAKQTKENDFVHFLSLTYCPIGAENDPMGLNVNWEKNVKRFLALTERKGTK